MIKKKTHAIKKNQYNIGLFTAQNIAQHIIFKIVVDVI